MSFLFGKKSKQPHSALPPATRDVHTSGGSKSQPNGVNSGTNTPSPDQRDDPRGGLDAEVQYGPRPPTNGASPPHAALYPWSQRRMTFTSNQSSPFPRYGAAVNAVASKEGDIYLMGGLVNGSTVKGDLWMIEAGRGNLPCYPIVTTSEGPGPRVGHASLLVGNAFIVFGGDTKMDERDKLDDTLYLLNTSTRHWSRSLPPGIRPAGRYGHTLNILGSKIYVFGGQVEGYFFNDLLAFDLNALQAASSRWEMVIPNSNDGGPPEGQVPPARTNHTVVSWNDKLYLFGGTNGNEWFNDVWAYDPRLMKWSQLDCIGYIPAPREGHSAALVNDVMYICGGRTEQGTDLGDLAAFKITSTRWYTFQNMGPPPSPRSGHSMTALGKQIVVLAGEPSTPPREPAELSLVYILDTAKIRYPNDQQIQQTPSGERVLGNQRPSTEQNAAPAVRGPVGRDPSLDNQRRTFSSSRESMVGPGVGPGPAVGPGPSPGPGPGAPSLGPGVSAGQGPANRVHDMSTAGHPGGAAAMSRLPRTSMAQAPSGPPPPQQAPPPRTNGVVPQIGGPRSKTPTKDPRSYGAPIDTARNGSFENETMSPTGESPHQEAILSISPMVNGRRTPNLQPQSRNQSAMGNEESRMMNGEVVRSRSRQADHQGSLEGIDDFPTSNSQQQQLQKQISFNRDYDGPNALPRPSNDLGIRDRSPIQAQQMQQLEDLKAQHDGLSKQLEATRSQNAWYASELALARKAGYQPTNSSNLLLEEGSFEESEKPMIEALIAMRAQLAEVQQSVDLRVNAAAQEVAEVEHQRDVAVREAVYAKAKLAAHGGGSHAGTPLSESMSRDLSNDDRSHDLGRKVAAALATQNELRATISSMTNTVETERRARELAEGAADAAQQRILDFEQIHNPGELESLRVELHEMGRTAREEAAHRSEAQSRAQILESDNIDLARRLEEALEDGRGHTTVFGSLREAVTASNEKASLLERKLDEERAQREVVDRKLLQLRAEHEERTAELENTARKLRDAEEMVDMHANESRKHRDVLVGGLDKIGTRDLAASTSAAADERVSMLQQQVDNAHALVRKNQSEANDAADKLRRAEERIAGLEAYQEQSSRESLTTRKQLQDAVRDLQSSQSAHLALQQRLEAHQRDASALAVQHSALKELLDERPTSRFNASSPNEQTQPRIRELEEQLESSLRAHQESKSDFESRAEEADKSYRERLEQLEHDYQTAVHYVKGTERMIKRMKDELSKTKHQNHLLHKSLEEAQQQQSQSLEPAEWEEERRSLRREIDDMQTSVRESVSQLERQLEDLQSELASVESERDHNRQLAEQTASQSHAELEQLKHENALLESRAVDAESKVTRLLDQVENSVTHFRRQSANFHSHHARNLSTTSAASAEPKTAAATAATAEEHPAGAEGTEERNSVALDHLASELETLRTHWEGTQRNYRHSNQFDFERTPTSATSATSGGGGELSDTLLNWRRRMQEEEERKGSSTTTSGTSVVRTGGGGGSGIVDPRVGGRPGEAGLRI
ncbi:MAG: hypothetical protein LQ342_003652 [Letrouitia transgressa]|nr:MAG: hypothetical protein LQ342_003652 [Letrouitia transgressa]